MANYAVVIDNVIVDALCNPTWCRYQARNKLMLATTQDKAVAVVSSDSTTYYLLTGKTEAIGDYAFCTLTEVDDARYAELTELLGLGETVEVEEEEEEYVYTTEGEEGTVEYLVSCKVSEMSSTCNKTISAGFDIVLSDGETHHFSLTTQDQLNLITLSTLIASGETVIPYHADGEQCRYYSVEDITAVMNMATFFKTYQVTYFNALKLYVQSLTTVSDIAAVYYGTEIPEEYVTDVLLNLMATAASDTE